MWHFEVTDTFGGEANYSWVRRQPMPARPGESQHTVTRLAVVRRLKAFAGLTYQRCTVDDSGDLITVTPSGRHGPCIIAFATWGQ